MEHFEDMIAWQKARALVGTIYRISGNGRFARDFGLRDQIRRAAVSIMSNLAEGFERGSTREFHQYLVVAKGSCAEVRSQLYVALDVEYIDANTFQAIKAKTDEVSRVIGGLRAAVKRKRDEA